MIKQTDFDQWGDIASKMQEPFKAIAELNVKALQGMTYLKPEDLANKPEEILEKQIHLAIENGHKALEYLKQSFDIIEKSMLDMNVNMKEKKTSKE